MNTEEAERIYEDGWFYGDHTKNLKRTAKEQHKAGLAAVILATRQATLTEAIDWFYDRRHILEDGPSMTTVAALFRDAHADLRALGEGE